MTPIPLYLMALIVAIAKTPLDIYQVCAWNHGTVKTEPWRSKQTSPVAKALRGLAASLRAWLGTSPALAAGAAAMALALLVTSSADAGVLAAALPLVASGASGLKAFRQNETDLNQKIAAAAKERKDIGQAVIARPEGERKMTDEERGKFLALGQKIEALEAELAENAEFLAAAEAANEAERNYRGPVPDPDAAASQAAKAATPAGRIEVGEDLSLKAPGYFGRQLQAVRKAALVLKGGDETLTSEDHALLKPMRAAATGANTDVPSEGGFLVGSQRASGIIQRAYEMGQVLSRVNRLPIGAGFNSAKLPAIDETSRADNSRYGGIVSGWLGQGNTLSSGKPKFREIEMKLRKVGAFVYSTDEMNVDSVLFEAWVNAMLPKELTFRTEDAVINGLGGNQPLGVMTSPAVLTVTRSVTGRINSDDMRNMWVRMYAPNRANAVWLYDQSCEVDFLQFALPIGTGGVLDPAYTPAGRAPGTTFATYNGRPMIPVEYCANLGTSGDIVLADLGEYYLIDKGGVQSDVSLHVAFLTDEAVYRFMYRVDGQLSWNAALTPKSGGSTLSCAVILST